jgi:hypothetical protein
MGTQLHYGYTIALWVYKYIMGTQLHYTFISFLIIYNYSLLLLAEVKRRFAEISETWFHFHFSF